MQNHLISHTHWKAKFYINSLGTGIIPGAVFMRFHMAKEFARAFYDSKEWRKCRQSFIAERVAIDGGMCQCCHERLGYMVHHTVMLTPDNIGDPDIALNHNCLEYICKPCHDREEGHFLYREQKQRRYMFDVTGNPVELCENSKQLK